MQLFEFYKIFSVNIGGLFGLTIGANSHLWACNLSVDSLCLLSVLTLLTWNNNVSLGSSCPLRRSLGYLLPILMFASYLCRSLWFRSVSACKTVTHQHHVSFDHGTRAIRRLRHRFSLIFNRNRASALFISVWWIWASLLMSGSCLGIQLRLGQFFRSSPGRCWSSTWNTAWFRLVFEFIFSALKLRVGLISNLETFLSRRLSSEGIWVLEGR